MTKVTPKGDEAVEAMLKRFTKAVATDGILQEVKSRKEFEKPSDKKRKKKAAGQSRIAKEKRKMEAYIKFHNENKVRPKKPYVKPEDRKDTHKDVKKERPERKPQPKPQTPKVISKPVTDDSLKALQDKFK